MAKIKSIKKYNYSGKVYDLTVKDVHAYNVDGLSVHNSAVGSLTLYVLGVTGLDPIKYDLLFERFLNPERISPPDVDIDFDYDKRHLIVEYVERKYGADHCCKIGTYQSMKARAIVRYVVKALDLGGDWESWKLAKQKNPNAKLEDTKLSLKLSDFIAKQVPEGPNVTIENTYNTCQEFRESVDKYKGLYDMLSNMEKILGSSGVHASGYVVCRDPIHEHVALRDSKGQVCCQFDGPEVEELGLLKFDFLGLKTLTVIVKTLESIKKRYGITIDLQNLDLNERETLDLFNGKYPNMETKGIFQFESYGMTKLLKSIKIDSFDDLIACNAIYRPGPLEAGVGDLYSDYKHGRKPIKPLHPIMGETLSKTYGLICYQEDFMKLARDLAGFSKGQCDTLRKACGKKKLDLLKQNRDLFVDGCKKVNNIDSDLANKIFDQIEYFGGYGFNKCLSGETKVLNKINGVVYTLKELSQNKIDVILDSYVDGVSIEDTVLEVFSTGKKDVYEVKLSNGMRLKCTKDHKFICSDGKKHTLKQINDDNLTIPDNVGVCKIVSLKYVGVEETFNIEMESEQHNYKIIDNGCFIYSANSHSAAYSAMAYYTAYLKVHYPIEFMCNLLTSEIESEEKLQMYIKECLFMGIVVKNPNINTSGLDFRIESGKNKDGKDFEFIRSPFTAIKGIGDKSVDNIVKNQPFRTFKEFLAKIDATKVRKTVFEALINTGCMDGEWGLSRSDMVSQYSKVKDEINKDKKTQKEQSEYVENFGGGSLFDRLDSPGNEEINVQI